MEDTYKTSTKTIIDLQNKNAKLRMGLVKLLKMCDNYKMQDVSVIWWQQIGFAKQMLSETDEN